MVIASLLLFPVTCEGFQELIHQSSLRLKHFTVTNTIYCQNNYYETSHFMKHIHKSNFQQLYVTWFSYVVKVHNLIVENWNLGMFYKNNNKDLPYLLFFLVHLENLKI